MSRIGDVGKHTPDNKSHDPIPGLNLPPWIERLILVAAKVVLERYLPHLLDEEDSDD